MFQLKKYTFFLKHMLKNIKYKMQKIAKIYRKREKSISTNLLFMGKTSIYNVQYMERGTVRIFFYSNSKNGMT